MIALEFINRGYKNTSVVNGGWNAMMAKGFPIVQEGKIIQKYK